MKLIIALVAFICVFAKSEAQLSYLQWIFPMSGNANSPSYVNEVMSISTDNSGHVITGGNVAGSIDLDPSGNTFNAVSASNTNFSGFVAKYDTLQNFIWGFTLLSPDHVIVRGVAADDNDNIYVSGEYINEMDADPGSGFYMLNALQAGRDMFISRYSSAGLFQWAFSLGGNASLDNLADMLVDGSGNIYITGSISDTVDFDPGLGQQLLNGTSGSSMYLAKYDSSGNYQWAFMIDTDPQQQEGHSLAFDNSGNILAGMQYHGTVDVDPSANVATFTNSGSRDFLVIKYSVGGAYLSAFSIGGGSGGPMIMEGVLTCDTQNNVIVTARYYGTMDMDPGPASFTVSAVSTGSVFLAKYSASGGFQWGFNSGAGNVNPGNLCSDNANNIYQIRVSKVPVPV